MDTALLETLSKSISGWFWVTDEQHNFVFVTQSVETFTGVPPDWYIGKSRYDIGALDIPADDLAEHSAKLEQREPFSDLVYPRRAKNGITWVSVDGSPTWDEDGSFTGYVGTARVVDAQVAAKQESRRLENHLRAAVEVIDDGFLLFDAEDRIIMFNDCLLNIYSSHADILEIGVKFEDVLRVAVDRGDFPEAVGREDEWIRERLERHRNPGVGFEQKLKDGRCLWIEERKTLDGGIVGIRRDITEQKKILERLGESEERYRLAVQHAAIWDWDIKKDKVFFSPQWRSYVGYSEEEFERIKSQSVSVLLHPDDKGPYLEKLWHHVRNPHTLYESEHRFRTAYGGYRWFYARGEVLSDETGAATRMVGINIDITEQKEAEARANQALQEAERANKAKSAFLANMSHELRTPLNSIIGFPDIMRESLFGEIGVAKYTDYISDIGGAARHLLSLIDELLDISKIEAEKMVLQESWTEVKPLLQAVQSILKGYEESVKHRVTFPAVPDGVRILVDERLIKQVLLNLLSNALKFTPVSGSITLSFEINQQGELQFAVRDTGAGIPADRMDKVSEAFFQVSDKPMNARDGTGLGLYLSKRFVELHGGHLFLESPDPETGVGTLAGFYLPPGRVLTKGGEGQQ